MNKAFVREPDETQAECPRCGSPGRAVGPAVLDAWLCPEDRAQLAETALFCATATCPVAYFDMFERTVPAAALLHPAWPKDPTAAVCACSGMTAAEIEEDAAANNPARVRQIVAQAQENTGRCAGLSPDGRPCLAEVQRIYIRARSG